VGPFLRPSKATHVIAGALIVLTLAGCSTWRGTRLAEPAPGAPATALPEQIRVYLADGRVVRLKYASVEGDSLRGISTRSGHRPLAFAVKDVRAIEARRASTGKTVLFVFGTVVLAAGILVLIAAIELANSD
jgi:hypothetical protein